MVQAVNLAVKDHAAMLKEIETLEPVTAAGTAACSSTVEDATVEAFGQGININDWADLLYWGNTTISARV
jgi:GTP cyclohydrolase III